MVTATRQTVIVKPGGRIEIHDPALPVGATAEVIVLIDVAAEPKTAPPESRGWPPGFFEQTYGSFREQPLVREPQGEYEVRDQLE